jgi:hypothetical protein
MPRSLTFLAGLFVVSVTLAFAQERSSSIEKRYPSRPEFEYELLRSTLTSNTVAQTDETALQNGGDWLLTQQFADGSYPWTVGEEPFSDSQGATARGMLTAYHVVRDLDHYNSAVRSGDYLVDSYPRRFSDGDPDFFPLDPLFLEELTFITGDNKYANFVQTYLWDKLNAGAYGEDDNLDAEEWADNVPVFEEFSDWVALEPLYRSTVAIAAHYTSELAIRDALLNSIVDKLEAIDSADKDGDLTGLAGAILASAHTGFNLDPQSGRWADANSTQDLVNILASYQRSGGDWPYDTSLYASKYVGDVSVTSWACKALKAWDAQTYAAKIASGLGFIKSLQQANGQILTNPGYSPETQVGVEIHAEALIALGADDGVLLNDGSNPDNQAPLAQDGSAITDEDTPVGITLHATDADNDPLTYYIVASPTKGALTPEGGADFTYTPNANANGSDSFTFRANDGHANSNIATITITIHAVNDAPVANNQSVSTTKNTAIAVTLTASDVDDDLLSYVIVAPPSHGTLTQQDGANVTYTPVADYVGDDSFTFKANDGEYDSNIATVSLAVNEPNPNTNLALNKPMSASSTNGSNAASRAADGNTSTYWRSGGVNSSVSAWLRVDLQAVQTLGRAVIRWYEKYYGKIYQVQVSTDDANWTTVHTDNAGNGGVDDISFAATNARYLRVFITKHNKSSDRIAELEVYSPASSLPRQAANEEAFTAEIPARLELDQNYPNPFNPATTIRYRISEPSQIVLKVLNTLGQEVAILVNGMSAAGEHEVRFDATGLPSGIYFSVLQAGKERRVARLQLLK